MSALGIDLPDANVWLALTDDRHVHHQAAREYWYHQRSAEIAFCRVTILALLRLATHPKVMAGKPFSPREAWDAYRIYRSLPIVRLMEDPETLEAVFAKESTAMDFPHRLWTDAYLAAFAMAGGARLVSFDEDFLRFPGLTLLLLKA